MKGVILIFFIFFSFNLNAKVLEPFNGASIKVSENDFIPHCDDPLNKGRENYSEAYSFVFTLEGGYGAYIQFLISNLGFGDKKGAVKANFDIPEGRHLSSKIEYDEDEWGYFRNKFYVKMGNNSIEGDLKKVVVKVKNDKFEGEFIFKNIAEPWRPGNGRVFYGSKDDYYDFKIMTPVAKIDGKVKISGETTIREVHGYGYSDHIHTNVAMHEQAKRWVKVRAINPHNTFILTEFHSPSKFGEKKAHFFVIYKNGKLFYETLDFELIPKKFNLDSASSYNVPLLFEIKKEKIHGAIKVVKATGREDYLEELNPILRAIVGKFAKPVMFYFDAKYAIEIQDGDKKESIGGKARYYYIQVTK